MDERLEQLIREQESDARQGQYQGPEPGVISYSGMEGESPEYAILKSNHHRDYNRPECHLHGREALKLVYGTYSGWRCTICEAESGRKYRSSPVVREKLRKKTAAWKADHPDEVRTYAREYKKRRYAEDPEYRAKEQARARAYKQRIKEAKKSAQEV